MLHNLFNASLLVYLSDSKKRTYTPPKPNRHREKWWGRLLSWLSAGRARLDDRDLDHPRGVVAATPPRYGHALRPPSHGDLTTKWWFFYWLEDPPFWIWMCFTSTWFLYDNLLGQWYLSDFYSMRVYENILPTSYWCFWQYVLVNWKSGHWMRVIQTLEFGQEIWQRLSINVNTMFEAILSRKKNPYPTLGSSENHRLKKCRLKMG